MADLLATAADLRALLQTDATTLPDTAADIALSMATAAVQQAAGQDLLYATTTDDVMGTWESFLDLPQRPVASVASVALDGATVTDFKKFGARLWRRDGWATCPSEPSQVTVAYSHGYPPGVTKLEYARTVALGAAAQIVTDPTGKVTGISTDDYQEQRSQGGESSLAGLLPLHARRALRRMYGPRGGLVSIG